MRNVVAANLATALCSLMLMGTALADPVSTEPATPPAASTPTAAAPAPETCPGNPDALGTSRTLVVDPAEHPRLGSIQYREVLPLHDHEVVLTFDDGPLPPRTTRILEMLDHECVKATFFLVGKMAHSYPDTVRRIRDAGHTIATHSNSHPFTFHRMTADKAQAEVNQGIANVTGALGDGSGPSPFFRIPGLLRADAVERWAASQHIQIWSADFVADDWTRISPAQVYQRAIQRIEAGHRGILLLHDIQPRTVEALPFILRDLKKRGYKIVHVVAASPNQPKTETEPNLWALHPHQASRPNIKNTELPAPSPTSFGMDLRSNSFSFVHKTSLARYPAWHSPAILQPFNKARRLPDLPHPFQLPTEAPIVVSEAHQSGDNIQHLLESLGDSGDHKVPSTEQEEHRLHTGPAANGAIPSGAFP